MKVKTASGPIRWFMKARGFAGWTSFWNTVYVLPGRESDQPLLRHEAKHLEQIRREGRIVFSAKYLYWLIRRGYWNHPYEIEARAAEAGQKGAV